MSAPFKIELSIQITRRKFVHRVTDSSGREVYLSRSISQVMQWLYDNDIWEAQLIDGERCWEISLSPLPA